MLCPSLGHLFSLKNEVQCDSGHCLKCLVLGPAPDPGESIAEQEEGTRDPSF